jgi:hypothetical protein
MGDETDVSKLVEMYPHSIEVTRGVKGTYGWTIKVRFKPDHPTVDMAKVVGDLDKELRERFKDQLTAQG